MLEIEFIDRSVALAGKAFVSFFPLVIVVAAFVPERIRSSIITAVTARLGMRGDALDARQRGLRVVRRRPEGDRRARSGAHDLLRQLVHDGAAARLLPRLAATAPRRSRRVLAWAGLPAARCWSRMALLGGLRGALDGGLGVGLFAIVALAATSALWWFSAWFLLLGDVRARVLVPTGVITGIATAVFAASATIWMPEVVTSNEAQFGVFGVALALVTWFSGAAICVLVGACAGVGPRRGPGRVGTFIRGGESADADRRRAPAAPATRTRAQPPRRVPEHRRR